MRVCHLILAAGLLVPAVAFAQVDPQIVREGEGPNRTRLTGKELKPFDAGAWTKLADWKNGTMTPAVTDGKPVLVLTWSDYIPTSKRALTLARKLSEKYGARGLVVVAAHNSLEWDKATKPEAAKDTTFLVAHDATGEFRAAIGADNDPDFFVIDRAGQLRYADIATEAVEAAVEKVVNESKEQAGGVVTKLAADAATRAVELRRTDALRTQVDMTSLPEVPFEMPSDESFKGTWLNYRSNQWPTPPMDTTGGDQQTRPAPDAAPEVTKVALPDTGWFPAKPELKGRMVLMYFWHPEFGASFENVDQFDLLQRQHSRDVVVVGVLTPLSDGKGGTLKIENDPVRLQKKLDQYRASRNIGHPILVDLNGSLFEMSKKHYSEAQSGVSIPWVLITSSDNAARWWGFLPRGQAAFDKVLANDPGLKARRAAEEKYIRDKGAK